MAFSLTQWRDEEDSRRFGLMVIVSLGIHALVAVFVATSALFVERAPLIDPGAVFEVEVVSLAVPPKKEKQRSALPDKVEPAPPPPPPPKAEEAPKEDRTLEEALKRSPPAPTPSLEQERRRAARERALARLKLRAAAQAAASRETQADADGPEEEARPKGSHPGADPAWAQALRAVIERHWTVLPSMKHKKMKVEVLVKTDALGALRSVEIVKASGDPGFDQMALRAVRGSAPLPLPSREDLRRDILIHGFVLGFNPRGMTQ